MEIINRTRSGSDQFSTPQWTKPVKKVGVVTGVSRLKKAARVAADFSFSRLFCWYHAWPTTLTCFAAGLPNSEGFTCMACVPENKKSSEKLQCAPYISLPFCASRVLNNYFIEFCIMKFFL